MPFIFPAHLFNPSGIKSGVVENVISGGTSLTDDEDVISTDGGGRWVINFSGIDLRTPAKVRHWEAWIAHLAGGAVDVLVPLVSVRTAPRPAAGFGLARPSAIHADDPYFPTEVGYATPHIIANWVDATDIRENPVTILVEQGARIVGGEKFSVGQRGYKVERVLDHDGQEALCLVSPPPREAIEAGAPVNFDWPVVLCRLVPGQDLDPELIHGRASGLSITFREHVGTDVGAS